MAIPKNQRVQLSILVVSYNTRDLTLACLRSVFRETHVTRFELIVVDNASRDGSADAISAEFPQARLIALDRNIGFADANNLAAKDAEGDLLLLLNPDTLVLTQAIDALVRFAAERPYCGIWGGRTLFPDRYLNPTSCWRAKSLWGLFSRAVGLSTAMKNSPLFNSEGYGGWERDSVREVDTVTGCFLLIGRRLWNSLGGFDTKFFMYGEDADLCLRARKNGAKPTITPNAEIIHYGGASETVAADKIDRLLRAKILLAKKHWASTRFRIAQLLLILMVNVRSIGYRSAGFVTRRLDLRNKADVWRDVWNRRRDWLKGW